MFFDSPSHDASPSHSLRGPVPQGFRDVVRRGAPATLGYQEFAPHARLSDWVQCYWSLQASHSHLSAIANRGLSKGYVDLILATGGAFCESAERWLGETGAVRCYLVGPMPEAAIAHSTAGVSAFGIRLRPGHAHALLGVPCGDLVETPAPVRALVPELTSTLLEQIAETAKASDRIALFERVLLKRAERRREAHAGLQIALQELRGSDGNTPMDRLLALLDVGARQLERLFYQHVGIAPKRMCQILRVQHAIRLAREQQRPDWSSIARHCGFFDQAHFIRQFKSVTGTSPTKYFAEPSLKLSEI